MAHLGVNMRVLLQAHGVAEGFTANVTGEGPRAAVGAPDVHLEPVGGGEHLQGEAELMGCGACGEGPGRWQVPVYKMRAGTGRLESPSSPHREVERQRVRRACNTAVGSDACVLSNLGQETYPL